jgi:uncharacterized protein YjbJ (UPF0337 family)
VTAAINAARVIVDARKLFLSRTVFFLLYVRPTSSTYRMPFPGVRLIQAPLRYKESSKASDREGEVVGKRRKSSGKDKAEGAMDKAKGRLKEAAGALSDDKDAKAEGRTDQRRGTLKEKKGHLKDLFK